MSIPKEPRQLMINLMYLVLTALLALNVSAEVMNAFFTLNKGIENSNKIVDNTNETINKNIVKQAEANKKDVNLKYRDNAQKMLTELAEFTSYVDGIKKNSF